MWKSKVVTFATKRRGMLSSRLGPKSWGLFWFNEPLRPCLGQSWPNWDVPGYFSSEGGGRSGAARAVCFSNRMQSKQPPPARGAAEERQESGPLPSTQNQAQIRGEGQDKIRESPPSKYVTRTLLRFCSSGLNLYREQPKRGKNLGPSPLQRVKCW